MGPQFDICARATNNPSYFALTGHDERDSVKVSSTPVACPQSGSSWVWTEGTKSLDSSKKREPESPRRRELKALLKSVSAKELEQAEAFLKGQPSPGDFAPGDMRYTLTAPRIKKGKIRSTVMTSEGPQEREEVFYTMPQTRRRHSVVGYLAARVSGSFGEVTAVPCDVPKAPAPKIKQEEEVTKRKRTKTFQFREMEDIAILWSSGSPESGLWSDYLVASFDKIMSQRARHHYRVLPMTVEEIMESESQEKINQLTKAQLQIVILCPKLAAKMSDFRRHVAYENVFKLDKVLVMLLGVNKEDIINSNSSEYPDIDQWQMMSVREKDTSFVDTFLTAAVGILRTKDCKDTATDRTSFSIIPKKVKIGQSRVIALLNDPIREEDSIKIMVDKKKEVIHISTFKRRNPYTLQFDIPESCLDISMLVWVRISKNGQSLGKRQIKCESRLRELDQLLRGSDHPLEFMCQTLGFKKTSREQLDSWMLSAFQKNIPPHFNLLSSPEQYNPKSEVVSGEEYPTLLHWAAQFGMERLCWQLLECPGGGAACALKNVRHMTPAELAKEARHDKLADVLASHMKMDEFSNMYYFLKNMSENKNDGDGSQNKEQSNNFNETQTDVIDNKNNHLENYLRIVESQDVVDFGGQSINNDKQPNTDISKDQFSEACTKSLERSRDNNIKKKLAKSTEQLYQNDCMAFSKEDNLDRNLRERLSLKISYVPEKLYTNDAMSSDKSSNAEKDLDKKTKERPTLKLPNGTKQLYQNDFRNTTSTIDRLQQAIEHDYLFQPSNIKVESPNFKANNFYVNSSRLTSQLSDLFLHSPTEEPKNFTIDTPTSDISQVNLNLKDMRINGSTKPDKESSPLNGQEELAEIITDFKNNVFTISEVEKLVMEWKNRNETQQSLKEKQEQLNKMREEYDKIQHKMKENMKRPTPFERVKKMFSKNKNKNTETPSGSVENRNSAARPNSSLSESSSSSGRLSTMSGGSIGETNSVQSEIDEKTRSFISSSTLTMHSTSSDIDNRLDDYLIPPPPRPLNGSPMSSFGHSRHEGRNHMATIVEREATASRERLDVDADTHVRLNFSNRDRNGRKHDNERPHMYMNIAATHT